MSAPQVRIANYSGYTTSPNGTLSGGTLTLLTGQQADATGTQGNISDPQTSFANSFAAFLLDQPTMLIRDLPSLFSSIRQTPVFTYVQDKWQVSSRLTLDLGLRHELWGPPKPQFPGGFSNYDPATNRLVLAGVGGNPMNLGRKTPWRNFGPRFGLAYRANERTVLRGGYGISTIPFPDNSYAFNYPVLQNNAFNPPDSFSAAGSLASGFPPPQPGQRRRRRGRPQPGSKLAPAARAISAGTARSAPDRSGP